MPAWREGCSHRRLGEPSSYHRPLLLSACSRPFQLRRSFRNKDDDLRPDAPPPLDKVNADLLLLQLSSGADGDELMRIDAERVLASPSGRTPNGPNPIDLSLRLDLGSRPQRIVWIVLPKTGSWVIARMSLPERGCLLVGRKNTGLGRLDLELGPGGTW